MDGNLTASDVALLTGNNRNDGMFGGDGAWWLIVLFLFVFCGWGNNGWGNNGNGGGYVATAATQADIQRGFDNSTYLLTRSRSSRHSASLDISLISVVSSSRCSSKAASIFLLQSSDLPER